MKYQSLNYIGKRCKYMWTIVDENSWNAWVCKLL